jgi:hypothetical protein
VDAIIGKIILGVLHFSPIDQTMSVVGNNARVGRKREKKNLDLAG